MNALARSSGHQRAAATKPTDGGPFVLGEAADKRAASVDGRLSVVPWRVLDSLECSSRHHEKAVAVPSTVFLLVRHPAHDYHVGSVVCGYWYQKAALPFIDALPSRSLPGTR